MTGSRESAPGREKAGQAPGTDGQAAPAPAPDDHREPQPSQGEEATPAPSQGEGATPAPSQSEGATPAPSQDEGAAAVPGGDGTEPEPGEDEPMIGAALRARVEAWISQDPDRGDQAELRDLVNRCGQAGDAGAQAVADLIDRFAGRLEFGTAGLRGAIGAGPNRMNRAVVRAATAALAGWLHEHDPGAASSGMVIGCDARHRSAAFADEAAAVLTGAGIRVHLLPRPGPTPLLAFAVRHLSAGAGIMITASHNPPADNGYKLYLRDGAQIVPPTDEQVEAAIGGLGPLSRIPAGPAGGPLVVRHGDEVTQAYLAAITGRPGPPAGPGQRTSGQAAPVPAEFGQAVSRQAVSGQAVSGQGTAPADSAAPAIPRPPSWLLPESRGWLQRPWLRRRRLRVVYTPLHGVAASLALRAIERAGFPAPAVVAEQAEPDPDFPTVAFPNPEEPGALDLALAQARRWRADLVLANDPDGDRLAVAVPDPAAPGGWRRLTGDQVGGLLGAYLLVRTADDPGAGERLVVTTIVSSALLGKIAVAAGAQYAETLTGFKWIVRGGQTAPSTRFMFGYEEALGYAVGDTVRDKDGISAALAVLALAAHARAHGQSLLDRWDELETAHGVHLTEQLTVASRAPGIMMSRLRAAPPAELAGQTVTGCTDLALAGNALPLADVLTYHLAGARVVIRPSGTEPKLKAYLEVVEPVGEDGLAAARATARARMAPLRAAVAVLTGGPPGTSAAT